jgi:CheY-like chemotaxis protein
LAWSDNALAHGSKTCLRICTYKAAHQKPLAPFDTRAATTPAFELYPRPDRLLMPTKREVVAVIDDDFGIRTAITRLLSALGYVPELYATADEFLGAAMTTEAICLIVDIELGESCGIEFARRLINAGFTTPIIFMTAANDASFKRRAMDMGCVAFLRKPFAPELLIEALLKIPRRT